MNSKTEEQRTKTQLWLINYLLAIKLNGYLSVFTSLFANKRWEAPHIRMFHQLQSKKVRNFSSFRSNTFASSASLKHLQPRVITGKLSKLFNYITSKSQRIQLYRLGGGPPTPRTLLLTSCIAVQFSIHRRGGVLSPPRPEQTHTQNRQSSPQQTV